MESPSDNEVVEVRPVSAQAQVEKIFEFPKDGRLWWLRWVDQYQFEHFPAGTPVVALILQRLDVLDLKTLTLANAHEVIRDATAEKLQVVQMTGVVPRLRLGGVFRNGEFVGVMPSHTLAVIFDLIKYPPQIVCISDLSDHPAPDEWPASKPYSFLNDAEFALYALAPQMRKSFAMVFRSEAVTVLMPCHVAFRSLFATCTEMALALTSGPWLLEKEKLLWLEETVALSKCEWQISLKDRVPDEGILSLANLVFDLVGSTCANSIWGWLNKSNGFLRLALPFATPKLKVKLAAFELGVNTNKYLAVDILAMEWPHSGVKINRIRHKNTYESELPIGQGTKKPRETRRRKDLSDSQMRSDTSATDQAHPIVYTAGILNWLNRPSITKKTVDIKHDHPTPATQPMKKPPMDSSASNTKTGASDARKAQIVGEPIRSESGRFQQVMALLNSLAAKKMIEDWSIVPPTNDGPVMHTVPTWPFLPQRDMNSMHLKSRWCYWRGDDLRCALVCKITYASKSLYWVEIECRPTEAGYTALLFTSTKSDASHALPEILKRVSARNGVWPVGLLKAETKDFRKLIYKHVYNFIIVKDDSGRKTRLRTDELNEIIAMNAIKRLLFEGSTMIE